MKKIKLISQFSLIIFLISNGLSGCAQTPKVDNPNTIVYTTSPPMNYDTYNSTPVSPIYPVPNTVKKTVAKPKVARKSSTSKKSTAVSSSNYLTHVVQRGENLYRIGLRYGVSQSTIKSANGLKSSALQVGQKLRIPGGKVSSKPSTAPVARQVTKSPTTTKTAVTKTAAKPAAKTVVPVQNISSCSPAPKWGWPSQGTVTPTISTFTKGAAININGSVAQPLKAAAAGTITFSGQGTNKRPNRITISHNRTFSTVYEYYGKSLVKIGSSVNLGQTIGELNPQTALHFEIRCYKKALNPLSYLPS